jgi:PEP-CTERM motif
MKKFAFSIFSVIVFNLAVSGFAQSFENLDFEQATIAPTPVGGWTFPADPTQCFPGWTVGPSAVVMYNDLSIGSPAVCLMGPNFPNFPNYTPLEGSYSVLLQYFGYAGSAPTLSQTGLVPVGTQSISFLVPSGQNVADSTATVVSLNGVYIPLVPIAGNRVAGNVSAFAGSVAQLTFSTINSEDFIYFDDIQFSTASVPEPSILGLFALGGLFFGLRRRCNSTQ